jgi:hypothetical protein
MKDKPITASWVIREIATHKVLFETFNPALVASLNTDRYEAVPIMEHLQSLNEAIKASK